MSESKQTSDRDTIIKWAEERKGVPSFIKDTESKNGGVLRIHFPQASDNKEDFEKISWNEFFDVFESRNLTMLYQEKKENGETSTFHKFTDT